MPPPSPQGFVQTVSNLAQAVVWWTFGTLMPSMTTRGVGDRVTAWWAPSFTFSPALLVAIAAILASAVAIWRGRAAARILERRALLLSLGASLAVFPWLVAFARGSDFRWTLAQGLYYAHLYWAFLLPLFWAFASAGTASRHERLVASGILAALILLSAFEVWKVNSAMREWSGPRLMLLSRVQTFLTEHEGEADLSFWMPMTSFDAPLHWMRKRDDPLEGHRSYKLAEVLHPLVWRESGAKYALLPMPVHDGQQIAVPKAIVGFPDAAALCADWGDGSMTVGTAGASAISHRYGGAGLFLAILHACGDDVTRFDPPRADGAMP